MGCYNKIPQARQLQGTAISLNSGDWEVKDRVPASLVFGESWLSVSQIVPFHCVLMEGTRELSGPLL